MGNVITQGIAVATGLQPKFDWKAVVTSAIVAPLGQALSDSLLGTQYDANGKVRSYKETAFTRFLGQGTVTPLTQAVADVLVGTVRQGVRLAVYGKGKLDFASIAADAFGSVMGREWVESARCEEQRQAAFSLVPAGAGYGLKATASNWDSFNAGLLDTINANQQARQGTAADYNDNSSASPYAYDPAGLSMLDGIEVAGGGRGLLGSDLAQRALAARRARDFDRFRQSEIASTNRMEFDEQRAETRREFNRNTTWGTINAHNAYEDVMTRFSKLGNNESLSSISSTLTDVRALMDNRHLGHIERNHLISAGVHLRVLGGNALGVEPGPELLNAGIASLAFSGGGIGGLPRNTYGPILPKTQSQFVPGSLGGNTARAAEFSPIPESYMKPGATIDMRTAPQSAGTNAAGFPRNGPWFWRQMADTNPEYFDAANLARIRAGPSPVATDTWVENFPQHQGFSGDKLVHHHIDQGPIATPLPETIHQKWYKALHPNQ